VGCEFSVVGSASCWVRWEICLFLLVEFMMSVGGFQLWVVSSRLWVFGCGFSVGGSRLSVVGCGLCFVLGVVGNLFVYTR